MEPIIEQEVIQPVEEPTIPVEPSQPVSTPVKVAVSTALLIASFTAGTQLDSTDVKTLKDDNAAKVEQIQALEVEKQAAIAEKDILKADRNAIMVGRKNLTEDYICSELRSGRSPKFDASYTSLNDIQSAYVKFTEGKISLSDTDIVQKAIELVEGKENCK